MRKVASADNRSIFYRLSLLLTYSYFKVIFYLFVLRYIIRYINIVFLVCKFLINIMSPVIKNYKKHFLSCMLEIRHAIRKHGLSSNGTTFAEIKKLRQL